MTRTSGALGERLVLVISYAEPTLAAVRPPGRLLAALDIDLPGWGMNVQARWRALERLRPEHSAVNRSQVAPRRARVP